MTTALMPLDPATTPQHANRLLPIRASLLPTEITAGRNARRVRFGIIGAVVLVLALMGAWYVDAIHEKTLAADDNADITSQVLQAQRAKNKYAPVTTVINKNKELTSNLKTLMTDDLRWSTLLDTIQNLGTPLDISITAVNGELSVKTTTGSGAASTALPSNKSAATVLGLTIAGNAPSKEAVATYVDTLGKQKTIANAFLTAATQASGDDSVTFTMTADVTADALCGRYTTVCKTAGGK